MTAKELHDITAPLYAKHPSAKPDCLHWNEIEKRFYSGHCAAHPDYSDWPCSPFAATLIIQGHLFEWLCRKGNAKTVTCVNQRWYVHDWRSSGRGATMLHALIEAAMEVPVC
jgi:hypothetical protein